MELYLDSVDLDEIEEASRLGFIAGLTTTPTFMFHKGITDIDDFIVKLSKKVSVLQIEALGNTPEEVLEEARSKIDLGLDPKTTVFKIPVSQQGIRACHRLRSEGLLVNIHLVYTLQQAYMAMLAGATYVCPLVGRLQDQGHDALALIQQCVSMVDRYGFDSKVMFSSVRHVEHVRNALNLGVHTITAPWKIIQSLTDNHFTKLGTIQFVEHTRLMTIRVKEIISTVNPVVSSTLSLAQAIVKMTEYGFGAVTIINPKGEMMGIFTDGDLRRAIQQKGRDILQKNMNDFDYVKPLTISSEAHLHEAVALFEKTKVDTLVVVEKNIPVGMLDIQDIKTEYKK